MMQKPQTEYLLRLNRVLDYIHSHLDEPLTLEVLANVANFSPFHFHRLFKGLTGETLSNYVQRARLEKAANSLQLAPELSILEIALTCGFSGAAVFTRAFRAYFGVTPSQYRQRRDSKNRKAQSKPGKETLEPTPYNGIRKQIFEIPERSDVPMNVEIKTLPALHVAYIRHIRGYSKGEFNREINAAFQQVCNWVGARDLFGPDTLVFGIPYDNPDITPNDRCRYDACVTIPPSVTSGSNEVDVQDVAGGKYAIVRIETSSSETQVIGETVDRLYGEWLPASGFMVDDRPALEIYHNNPDKPAGTWITMDYCVPIRPL